MHILITRPEPDATRWQTHLEAHGHTTTVDPLLRIERLPLDGIDFTGVQALIATSRNGLRGLEASLARAAAVALPIYTVGPGTAELAAELGFAAIIQGPSSARELAPLIAASADPSGGRLIHLSGDKIAFDLAAALAPAGLQVDRVTVYRSQPVTELRSATIAALSCCDIDIVTLMSPLSATTFVSLLVQYGLFKQCQRLVYVCLSENVAARVRSLNPSSVHVASRPNSDDMLVLVDRLVAASK